LAKVAKEIFVGFPEAERFFPAKKTVLSGNPIRPEIAALREHKIHYSPGETLVILIMGGSQGANRLNLAAMELAAKLIKDGRDFEIIHQTGANDEAIIGSYYERLGLKHETKAFFVDPQRLYQKAHLAITRGGALTITELAAVGLPAIVTPLPTAADDHQTINAQSLVSLGAGILLKEDELSGLFPMVKNFMDNPRQLNNLSGRARNLANFEAASLMARRLIERIY
jgi:UDP-N-acetylglucosamine--N-acetylmuramyl-(pentapeptide) pyrophosphoryl-undecaprenol N-acetylglucosamine transferase